MLNNFSRGGFINKNYICFRFENTFEMFFLNLNALHKKLRCNRSITGRNLQKISAKPSNLIDETLLNKFLGRNLIRLWCSMRIFLSSCFGRRLPIRMIDHLNSCFVWHSSRPSHVVNWCQKQWAIKVNRWKCIRSSHSWLAAVMFIFNCFYIKIYVMQFSCTLFILVFQ